MAGSPSVGVLLSRAATGSDTVVPGLPSGLQELGLAAAPSGSGTQAPVPGPPAGRCTGCVHSLPCPDRAGPLDPQQGHG